MVPPSVVEPRLCVQLCHSYEGEVWSRPRVPGSAMVIVPVIPLPSPPQDAITMTHHSLSGDLGGIVLGI